MSEKTTILWKAVEMVMKAVDKEEDATRRSDMLNAVDHLTDIHKSCVRDYQNVE